MSSTHPATDYDYLGTTGKFQGRDASLKLAAPSGTPSFRKLSNDFIGSEMKRDYVAEAVFFAIIVAVSTWPIVSMIAALANLVK
jgi:hypothetical protein